MQSSLFALNICSILRCAASKSRSMSSREKPIRWACRVALLAALWIPAPSHAQVTDPGQVVTPEQMVDDAIKKLESGNVEEAGQMFNRVRRMKPDMPRLNLLHGLLLIEMNQPLEALPKLEAFNSSKDVGNEYRGFNAVGRVYIMSRMHRQAIRPLERAKDYAPAEENGKPVKAEIAIELASALFALDRTKDALKVADEAAALAPNDPGIQLKLGTMYKATQDYPTALKAADKATALVTGLLRTDPFKPEVNVQLRESYDLKIDVYQAQRAANPDDANIFQLLSQSMREQANAERRIKLLTAREYGLEAINKDPRHFSAQVFVARLEWELGGAQDALDRLKKVLEEDASNADAATLRETIQNSLRAGASE
ncbi:MAG: hypothetical protein DCC65_10485 [Planctomycetota bacterium]|nr:MAG: hypothetical protein DCC65_10485 [Planctomycetota bacterium]